MLVEQRVIDADHLRQRVTDVRSESHLTGHPRAGAHGSDEASVPDQTHVALLLVDAPVAVDSLEIVRERTHVLARAKHQYALALEREVQQAEDLLLCKRLQIDEQVATAHQIDAGKRRV